MYGVLPCQRRINQGPRVGLDSGLKVHTVRVTQPSCASTSVEAVTHIYTNSVQPASSLIRLGAEWIRAQHIQTFYFQPFRDPSVSIRSTQESGDSVTEWWRTRYEQEGLDTIILRAPDFLIYLSNHGSFPLFHAAFQSTRKTKRLAARLKRGQYYRTLSNNAEYNCYHMKLYP